jgi:hypothetical protein
MTAWRRPSVARRHARMPSIRAFFPPRRCVGPVNLITGVGSRINRTQTYGPFAPCARLRGNWPKGEAQTAPVSGGTLACVGLHAIGVLAFPLKLSSPRAPSLEASLAGAGKRRAGNFHEALILSARPRRLDEASRPARRCYWNSFRMSCAFWLAIDSDWMPSCSWVWSACSLVDAVFMSASTIPEMPSE